MLFEKQIVNEHDVAKLQILNVAQILCKMRLQNDQDLIFLRTTVQTNGVFAIMNNGNTLLPLIDRKRDNTYRTRYPPKGYQAYHAYQKKEFLPR